jgi:hypothetical protein
MVMAEITVTLLDDDEELSPDVEVLPDIKDMEPEAAVRHLMDYWGLDEADARFHLALARGETDGETHAIDDQGRRVRSPRQDRTTA